PAPLGRQLPSGRHLAHSIQKFVELRAAGRTPFHGLAFERHGRGIQPDQACDLRLHARMLHHGRVMDVVVGDCHDLVPWKPEQTSGPGRLGSVARALVSTIGSSSLSASKTVEILFQVCLTAVLLTTWPFEV